MPTISHEESLERVLADVELLLSAYPDEAKALRDDNDVANTDNFPFRVQLTLSDTAFITLEWEEGYPVQSSIQIHSYRSSPNEKSRMETTVTAVRTAAEEALGDQIEAGFMCAAAAKDTWEAQLESENKKNEEMQMAAQQVSLVTPVSKVYEWKTGEPLTDRKSAFQAHICRIEKESDVKPALFQLLNGNSKIQRASHNMWAYRVQEAQNGSSRILKHDNDDDGEDAAGSRLAHLLGMRQEDGVLVVVSRWFGGIHLGPKRFAHISNVARDMLVQCHEDGTLPNAS